MQDSNATPSCAPTRPTALRQVEALTREASVRGCSGPSRPSCALRAPCVRRLVVGGRCSTGGVPMGAQGRRFLKAPGFAPDLAAALVGGWWEVTGGGGILSVLRQLQRQRQCRRAGGPMAQGFVAAASKPLP